MQFNLYIVYGRVSQTFLFTEHFVVLFLLTEHFVKKKIRITNLPRISMEFFCSQKAKFA